MAAIETHHLFNRPISDHCFSSDQQTLIVGKDTEAEIYGRSGSDFTLQDTLRGHDKLITGVDIAPSTGRIVTCSQDRNAYVWEKSSSGWKPTLVLLRINRAATCVRWSPTGTKFAVGSGARVVAVCYFEQENDWWVSKQIKKPLRSTVTSIAWHPNSVLLAAGSADAHTRVFSGYIKGIDERPEPSVWGERLPFNTLCLESSSVSAGWIHACAFSPSGNLLAFSAHNSSLTIVYPQGPDQPPRATISVETKFLPFCDILWNGENEIIAAGYDCEAYRCTGNEQAWTVKAPLDSSGAKSTADALQDTALNLFRQMDLRGSSGQVTRLPSVHQNTVSTIRAHSSSGSSLREISTSGVDGRVVVWKI